MNIEDVWSKALAKSAAREIIWRQNPHSSLTFDSVFLSYLGATSGASLAGKEDEAIDRECIGMR